MQMARTPEGAELVDNPSSGAPGIRMENVYILAGAPSDSASMLAGLTGKIRGGHPVMSATVGARAPESEVADLLRQTEKCHPGVAIGSYPFFKDGRYGANFVIRSVDGALVDEKTGRDLSDRLEIHGGIEPIEGGLG